MIMDGRVMVEDVTSSMMGMPFKGQGMRGYDNVSGKYWGTWVDSMSTGDHGQRGDVRRQGDVQLHRHHERPHDEEAQHRCA
jgi:hypothetical protein